MMQFTTICVVAVLCNFLAGTYVTVGGLSVKRDVDIFEIIVQENYAHENYAKRTFQNQDLAQPGKVLQSELISNVGESRYQPRAAPTTALPPPPFNENARMARYIAHKSDWTTMATICSRDPLKSYPFANVFSVSDGADINKSTGIPYFYMSSLEISVHDLMKDDRASITMSLAQSDHCSKNHLDPEDPRCAHLIITGIFSKLEEGSEEEVFAKDALWSRHPAMENWISIDHGWFFAKLNIENIQLLDFFGGVKTVKIEDYLKATPY